MTPINASKYILLLGGTGAMGVHLARILSEKGYHVIVTSRKDRPDYNNIHFVQGNAKDETFITQILKERLWDCVVDFMTYSTTLFRSRIELLLSNTKRYVYLSSSRVYAECQDRITEECSRLLDVCEDRDYLATDEYALYKAREEDILMKSIFNNYTIIRPYITYSEYRLPLGVLEKEGWIDRCLRGKSIVITKDFLNKTTSLAYGKDVSSIIAELIGNNKSIGEVYNIATEETVCWKDVLDFYISEISRCTGKTPHVVTIDRIIFNYRRAILNLIRGISRFGFYHFKSKDFIFYQYDYDRLFERSFDMSKIKNLQIRCSFMHWRDGLSRCVESYITENRIERINWAMEGVYDKIANEFTPLSEVPTIKYKCIYLFYRYLIPRKVTIQRLGYSPNNVIKQNSGQQ